MPSDLGSTGVELPLCSWVELISACSRDCSSNAAATYNYNVPGNVWVYQAAIRSAEIATEIYGDNVLASIAHALARNVSRGIAAFGIHRSGPLVERFGPLYAYEVDGLGNQTGTSLSPLALCWPRKNSGNRSGRSIQSSKWLLSF